MLFCAASDDLRKQNTEEVENQENNDRDYEQRKTRHSGVDHVLRGIAKSMYARINHLCGLPHEVRCDMSEGGLKGATKVSRRFLRRRRRGRRWGVAAALTM